MTPEKLGSGFVLYSKTYGSDISTGTLTGTYTAIGTDITFTTTLPNTEVEIEINAPQVAGTGNNQARFRLYNVTSSTELCSTVSTPLNIGYGANHPNGIHLKTPLKISTPGTITIQLQNKIDNTSASLTYFSGWYTTVKFNRLY